MKDQFFTLLGLFILLSFSVRSQSDFTRGAQISIMTWNIRLDTPDDGPNAWGERKDRVISLIKSNNPSIFCLQEVLVNQLKYFEGSFKNYQRIGVGRDDGREAGEFSPLFVNLNKFLVVESSTFWLSATPGVAGSHGWDAACNRVVTWAKIRERITGKEFFVFNTHFDHVGLTARENSALLLLKAIDSLTGELPAMITGDFNARPSDQPIKILLNSGKPGLTDTRAVARKISGPDYTFTGFKVSGLPGERIDYIFVKGNAEVSEFKVIDVNNGVFYPSDHLPVMAFLRLRYPR